MILPIFVSLWNMRKLKTIIHQHFGNINMQKLPKLQFLSVLSLIHTQDVPSDPKVLAFTILLVASALYLALIITILYHNKLHELGARYEFIHHGYQATPSPLQYLDCACTPVSELYLSTFDPLLCSPVSWIRHHCSYMISQGHWCAWRVAEMN